MDITIILLIVNVFTAVAVIGLTLIQQPKGDMGSAFGGGGSQSMFGSRGSANFLTKSTSWMCFFFFATSLMLAYLYAQVGNEEGVLDQSVIQEVSELPGIVEAVNSTDSQVEEGLPQLPIESTSEPVEVDAAGELSENDVESVVETVVSDAVEEEATQKPSE